MRYFSFISVIFLTFFGIFLHSVPTYDMTVERSPVYLSSDGTYHIAAKNAKNIWYIGLKNSKEGDEELCVEWDFSTEKKQECIDHDGETNSELFSFPVLADATAIASFRILG